MAKDKGEKGEVSRRDFLVSAGAVVIGGAIGAGITYPLVPRKESSLEILNPVGDLATEIVAPAPRLDTLDGKRVGLYVARKENTFEFMARVAENLKNQFKNIEVIGGAEGTVWVKKSYNRAGDIDVLLAEKPDAIIMALSS